MAKLLKDILKQAHDTIKGVRTSSTSDGSTGKDPGVDYDPKAGDEQEFVAKHSVQKWDDVHNNKPEDGVKYSLDDPKNSRFGHKHGEDEKAYFVPVKEAKESEDAKCNHSPKGKMCPVHGLGECWSMNKVNEGEKVDRMEKHIEKSERKAGKSKEKAASIAWATLNKRGYLNNKNKKMEEWAATDQLGGTNPWTNTANFEDAAEPMLEKDDDGGADMVKTELRALANKALDLVMHMPDGMHVEPWVQAKIAMAKAGVSSVHDYMIYGNHGTEDEQAPADTAMTFPGMNADNARI